MRFYEFIQSHFLSRQQCIASPADLVVPWQQGRCDNKLHGFVRKCEAIRWQADLPRGILYDFAGAGLGNYWSLIFTELKYENLNKFDTSIRHEIQFLSTSPFLGVKFPFQKPGLHLSQICAATLLQRQSVKVTRSVDSTVSNSQKKGDSICQYMPVCDSATSGHRKCRKCTVACYPSKKVDLHFNPF